MGKISVLDPLTANQIAAGEVVDRPASVIKELIENSIDAGSTRIKIILSEGGTKRIQVMDNGWGMSSGDLEVAIERHATSKIKTVQDLNSLSTLGFRGEALPSIASVSKMVISSRTSDSSVGFSLQVHGGTKKSLVEIGCPVGTEITVDDLFYNTPARKKFLKSSTSELGSISDLVGRLAMSQPRIAFELMHDKKTLLRTPGNGDLAQVIFSIYGNEIARNMKMIKQDHFPAIWGYISIPSLTRSSRHYYNFFLNGRLVKSQELFESIEEAYYTRIPHKRYPVAVVNLEMSPELFDVNVHPAKIEVKFRDLAPIKESLFKLINSTLTNPYISIPQIENKPIKKTVVPVMQQEFFDHAPILMQEDSNVYTSSSMERHQQCSERNNSINPITGSGMLETRQLEQTEETKHAFLSSLKVLGQIEGTYIIASGKEGLYIIDQHAAHERIRYEKIAQCFRENPSASSLLSVPVTIELSAQQALWLINNIVQVSDLGFIFEHFGDNTFLLRGVPTWHIEGNSQELLLDLLEKLGSGSVDSINGILTEEKLFSLACKSAIKANRFLTDADIEFLLQQLDLVKNPFTCPHGRPIIITLTHEEIKRRFLRT